MFPNTQLFWSKREFIQQSNKFQQNYWFILWEFVVVIIPRKRQMNRPPQLCKVRCWSLLYSRHVACWTMDTETLFGSGESNFQHIPFRISFLFKFLGLKHWSQSQSYPVTINPHHHHLFVVVISGWWVMSISNFSSISASIGTRNIVGSRPISLRMRNGHEYFAILGRKNPG